MHARAGQTSVGPGLTQIRAVNRLLTRCSGMGWCTDVECEQSIRRPSRLAETRSHPTESRRSTSMLPLRSLRPPLPAREIWRTSYRDAVCPRTGFRFCGPLRAAFLIAQDTLDTENLGSEQVLSRPAAFLRLSRQPK